MLPEERPGADQDDHHYHDGKNWVEVIPDENYEGRWQRSSLCNGHKKKMDWPLDLMVTPPVLPIRKPYDCRRDKNNNTSKSVGENVEEHTLVITMKIMTEMELAIALAIEMKILKNIYQ